MSEPLSEEINWGVLFGHRTTRSTHWYVFMKEAA